MNNYHDQKELNFWKQEFPTLTEEEIIAVLEIYESLPPESLDPKPPF